jgi:hypothetical protein
VADAKICGLSTYMGFCCKELIAESQFTFIADNFTAFSDGNRFFDCSGNRLPVIG